MFVRAFTLVLAIAASAIASPGITPDDVNQCNNGQMQCCDQTMTANQAESLLGLVGLGPIAGLVGVNCNPIVGVLGGSGAQCTSQAVCCSNTQDSGIGLIGIDCSPINVGA